MTDSVLLLLITGTLLIGFLAIVAIVYRRGARDKMEQPKHRMLDDDDEP